jgi:hypothetical protein
MEARYVGVYQRPSPPKRPLGLNSPKIIQKPPVAMHEIEAQARAVMKDIAASTRKPGRPSLGERPMTPAERQARRRALQSREQAIREALKTGDAHGKSRAEANCGGYDSVKLDTIYGSREIEFRETEDGIETHVGRRIRPAGASSECDEKSYQDLRDAGGSFHRGGFDCQETEETRVDGLQIGNEESNRRRFAQEELAKIVGRWFTSPTDKTPSASWVAKHIGNTPLQSRGRLSITFTCNQCGESMESIEDAQDHLRVDHRDAIDEWFKNLTPRREFRDMGDFVTIVMPRKSRKPSSSTR